MGKRILSISVDDFTIESGGVNKVILQHEEFYQENEIEYVYIFPLQMPNFGLTDVKRKWVLLQKKKRRVVGIESIIKSIKKGCFSAIHVHHFSSSRFEEIEEILFLSSVNIYFIIHDYYTICPHYTNDLVCKYTFEGACCKGNCKCVNQYCGEQYYNLFLQLKSRLIGIAPSEAAKNAFVHLFTFLKDRVFVEPHELLIETGEYPLKTIAEPVRVGFIGSQFPYKGWEQYKDAVKQNVPSGKYIFYQLGSGEEKIDGIKQIPVSIHDGNSAMVLSMQREKIDVAILISTVKETYSFTVYECICAGVYVITTRTSGNIEAEVKKSRNGVVLENAHELVKYLEGDDLVRELSNFYSEPRKKAITKTNPALLKLSGEEVCNSNVKIPSLYIYTAFLRLYRFLSLIYGLRKC